ncbi:type I restriction-modification system subunit M N-terminal domain-containing protein [uncultured Acetobacterium sp.]|uniref:type I restriction-modification system subunit M N-terminal domain-containing protein n=1 Tax=uncultured Acetobacterium sp. TaxID=217139 RepID=UPI0025DB95AD|nr:type I restriction-modification system subunit M N-terminal domain-containing protein [uncultured Acetobacterium sp.]
MTALHKQTNINVQEKANMIWSIADIIRGTFKPHEYGRVILPMTLLKRLNDTLLPTKQAVLDKYEEVKSFEVKDGFLTKASGYSFYNISPFTFESLLNEPDHIEENFKSFLSGFSENIQDIIKNFKFENVISDLAGSTKEEDKLYYVIQEFNKPQAYMGVRATPKSPKADGLACPEIDGYNDHKKSRERKMPLKDARFTG